MQSNTGVVPSAHDWTKVYGGDGNDTLVSGSGREVMYGGDGDDQFTQGFLPGGSDEYYGGAGNDLLSGTEVGNILDGGDGFDSLQGGLGADSLTGGADADLFVFAYVEATGFYQSGIRIADRDRATDFVAGVDHLRIVNAVIGSPAPQLIGSAAFSAPDQVRWVSRGGDTMVFVNTDADPKAEMAIALLGVTNLQATDFF